MSGAALVFRHLEKIPSARIPVVSSDVFRRDENGFFYFVGRVDDMFVCGGENIYPGEVEKLLGQHPDHFVQRLRAQRALRGPGVAQAADQGLGLIDQIGHQHQSQRNIFACGHAEGLAVFVADRLHHPAAAVAPRSSGVLPGWPAISRTSLGTR